MVLLVLLGVMLFALVRRTETPEPQPQTVAEKDVVEPQPEPPPFMQQDFMRRLQEVLLGIEPEDYKRETVECRWEEAIDQTLTNGVLVVKVWLNDRIVKIEDCVDVTGPTQLYVVGPGTLDVDLSGTTNVAVKLLNRSVLLNRTEHPYPESGIRYSLFDDSYLNFVNLTMPEERNLENIETDRDYPLMDWGGPLTYREAQINRFNILESRRRREAEERQGLRQLDDSGAWNEAIGF